MIYQNGNITINIECSDKTITKIEFILDKNKLSHNLINKTNNAFEEEIKKQFDEYLAKDRKMFDLPIDISKGTEFRQKSWNALMKIPYGKAISYKELATMVGNPKASRAVGNANNKNLIPIIIPCHRVIGSNGTLVGYAGGLDIKKRLLELEGVKLKNS